MRRDLPLVHHTRSCFCCRQKVISWSASWFLQEVGRLLSDFGRLVGREKETGELLSAFVLSPSWSKNCSAFHRHTQIIWTRERLQRWEQLINTGDSYRTDFRERNIIPFENLCIKNAFLHQAGVNAGWKGRMQGIEERISPGGWRSPVYYGLAQLFEMVLKRNANIVRHALHRTDSARGLKEIQLWSTLVASGHKPCNSLRRDLDCGVNLASTFKSIVWLCEINHIRRVHGYCSWRMFWHSGWSPISSVCYLLIAKDSRCLDFGCKSPPIDGDTETKPR